MAICPRDFQEYATVEQVTETSDGAGGYTDTWTERVGIWCLVEDTGQTEGTIAGRLEHEKGVLLTTHFNPDIVETDRFVLEGETYRITGIEDVDRKRRYMRITGDTGRT